MIVSDLDGTLLSEDNTLTGDVKDAIQRFRSMGGLFTIATGRIGQSTKKIVDELDLDIPFILCNGSVLADRQKVWEAAILPLADLAPFLLEAHRQELPVLLFEDKVITAFRYTHDIELFERKEHVVCNLIDPYTSDWVSKNISVQKVLVIGDIQRIQEIWHAFRDNFQQNYTTVQSENDFFEIMPPDQSKGNALRKLLSHLNIAPSEVMSIGNQLNDLDMIQNAGIGVAVANSHEDLKKNADYVCRKSYGEGVIEAMEKYAKIGPESRQLS